MDNQIKTSEAITIRYITADGRGRGGLDWHYPRAAAVRSVRLIGSSFASHKSAEGAAFGRHPPERRATLWISYGIRSRNG